MFFANDEREKLSREALESAIQDYEYDSQVDNLTGPSSVCQFNQKYPFKGETLRIIYTDTQLKPIAFRDFDIQEKQITDDLLGVILRDSTTMSTPQIFMSINRTFNNVEFDVLEKFKDNLDLVNFKTMDLVAQNDDKLYTYEQSRYDLKSNMIDYIYRDFERIDSKIFATQNSNFYRYLEAKFDERYSISEIRQAISDEVITNQFKENYPFLSDGDVKKIVKEVSKQEFNSREELGIVSLKKGKIIGIDTIFKGGISSTTVDNRIIMKELLSNEADGFLIFHNHPSGVTKPSNPDKNLTKKLSEVSKLYNITYVDHFIIGKGKIRTNVAEVENVRNYQVKFKPKRLVKKKVANRENER